MIIANGNVISVSATSPDWVVAFDLGDKAEIVAPVIGWATLAQAVLNDGSATTRVEPAFLWGDMVWTETELREHSPGLTRFGIRPYVSATAREWAAAFAHQPKARA